ncbi:MAG: lytic transglycosylase domain-containing protein [Burkholderiaceae bacterium]|nr:lytic transglycosylase domain-containing protein [Burkholderiaceae bacterium]
MRQAWQKRDSARLTALLPRVAGHPLEVWGAYWELRARIDANAATLRQVQDFAARWSGTYQEDRLRNDWLLWAGRRRDWAGFAAELPRFRMGDDPQVRCYSAASGMLAGHAPDAQTVRRATQDWLALRDVDDGCQLAASLLYQRGLLPATVIWAKAWQAAGEQRWAMARAAATLVMPEAGQELAAIQKSPARYLAGRSGSNRTPEMLTLALARLAVQDAAQVAQMLGGGLAEKLSERQRNWAWGAAGAQAAFSLSDLAPGYFAKVTRDADLSHNMLAWKARAALRQGDWTNVLRAIHAMQDDAEDQEAWVYWKARAQIALAGSSSGEGSQRARDAARASLEKLASAPGSFGYYAKLAREDLGRPIAAPPAPAPLTVAEKENARRDIGLNRALLAIAVGLRNEGAREWNYVTRLHTPGGMSDRALYAAADLACQYQAWDRCINSSERTRGFMDFAQRFPLPYRAEVLASARDAGLDPAYVYGLIRQESRFVPDARSSAGASGLMQLMPATARWMARKTGLDDFKVEQVNVPETNLLLGTRYLALALADLGGSLPLAAAAYNAGPSRARLWRAPGGSSSPTLDGAIWVENIPFRETRNYVKQVLSNTTDYAARLGGGQQPQSLRQRLGVVGPPPPTESAPDTDLP